MAKVVDLAALTKKFERLVNESNDIYQEIYILSVQPGFKTISELIDKHQAISSEILRLLNDKLQRYSDED